MGAENGKQLEAHKQGHKQANEPDAGQGPPLVPIHLGLCMHVVFVFIFKHTLSGTAYQKHSFDIF